MLLNTESSKFFPPYIYLILSPSEEVAKYPVFDSIANAGHEQAQKEVQQPEKSLGRTDYSEVLVHLSSILNTCTDDKTFCSLTYMDLWAHSVLLQKYS